MKILLLGKTGQVGNDLQALLAEFSELHAADRGIVDLRDTSSIRNFVGGVNPDVILNAAAYTAVDKAESEPEIANAINAAAPAVLAEEAARTGALLIHYSTDYVFDGKKTSPYVESDALNPINVYGRSKGEGEKAITRSGCKHLIFRTSWVYSHRGSNFLLTMLRLAKERDELRIVDDQIGAPTSSQSLATATAAVIRQYSAEKWEQTNNGVYHMTDSGETSWYGFADAIFKWAAEEMNARIPRLLPIKSAEYPTPAKRPLNSRLSCAKLRGTFEISMPKWQDSLKSVLGSVCGQYRSR